MLTPQALPRLPTTSTKSISGSRTNALKKSKQRHDYKLPSLSPNQKLSPPPKMPPMCKPERWTYMFSKSLPKSRNKLHLPPLETVSMEKTGRKNSREKEMKILPKLEK
ncbi:hypothetical protein ECG_07713 [Echinococcus granulosus]|uniref:Uncharacterized protein n=1 Tax=Echinococcus granulosus TaxID=6210 RepID=U6JGG7_ECHGR|nr:hypothetical protein EGR_10261 [Echinococcus granulosus]EUB54868.1 hypothetical protein EGR_10261 [Echinococcus granulosus]KAH9279590.1 hypothetical protein ECG_07713 [Echinococcus granulosus]CDS22415.1 hypothetical protein EgrG_000361800 [Echinococcus granulosus]